VHSDLADREHHAGNAGVQRLAGFATPVALHLDRVLTCDRWSAEDRLRTRDISRGYPLGCPFFLVDGTNDSRRHDGRHHALLHAR
jgi:hypothetical protein